jgi:predicted DNA-binding protein
MFEMDSNDEVKMSIGLSEDTHQRLKFFAIRERKPLKRVVVEVIEDWIKKNQISANGERA